MKLVNGATITLEDGAIEAPSVTYSDQLDITLGDNIFVDEGDEGWQEVLVPVTLSAPAPEAFFSIFRTNSEGARPQTDYIPLDDVRIDFP